MEKIPRPTGGWCGAELTVPEACPQPQPPAPSPLTLTSDVVCGKNEFSPSVSVFPCAFFPISDSFFGYLVDESFFYTLIFFSLACLFNIQMFHQ